jgi:ATP-binding cassette subfamily G (WHITE) protein 2 (SNQ2)
VSSLVDHPTMLLMLTPTSVVLGSPGSGCTTFLKMLANQRDTYHDVQGQVHYDSMSPKQIAAHYRGDVQYSPEDDVHFPTLTVEETIRFAARTRTPHVRADGQSRDELIEEITDVLTTVFGLRHVRKTRVGDAGVRGVSGGEKKRVSIAEALACRSLINCWDKYVTVSKSPMSSAHHFVCSSTRGLDSSTALEFVQALRIGTDVARITTAMSVYQASENVYDFFDKVCVIYRGRMVYYGPTSLAREYFIDMGYQPANRQTTPDFLVAVTDPNARIVREGYENLVPRTADEFVDHYRKSNIWQVNQEDMDAYLHEFVGKPQRASAYMESARAEHATTSKKKSAYVISIPMQTRAVMVRRLQILKGNAGGSDRPSSSRL